MKIHYELIEGTENNCVVIIEPSGWMSIQPIDEFKSYSFSYREIINGDINEYYWDSNEEMSNSTPPPIKWDSNLKSKI